MKIKGKKYYEQDFEEFIETLARELNFKGREEVDKFMDETIAYKLQQGIWCTNFNRNGKEITIIEDLNVECSYSYLIIKESEENDK